MVAAVSGRVAIRKSRSKRLQALRLGTVLMSAIVLLASALGSTGAGRLVSGGIIEQVYDLVLKADVGVVDVSFQRKQDKTSDIQKKSAAKDRELKQLDEEFKEVLKDVD